MTPEERAEFNELKNIVMQLTKSDRYTFTKLLQILDGRNIQGGLTTGTKIGTSTSQKFAFYNATPVIQASAIAAPTDAGALYSQTVAQSAVTAINSIRTALKNFGITA